MCKALRLSAIGWFVGAFIGVSTLAWCAPCTTDGLCGPRCLLVVCQKLDVQAGLEELTALCGHDTEKGTTLLGLLNAAQGKGLQAVAMKIGVDELATLKAAAIAHLWDSHFVVVEPKDANSVSVTNPPGEAKVVKNEDFKKRYSGFALLVAKDAALFPKSEPNGPDLRVDGYTWDFGAVLEGDKTEYSFKCRNVGNADLVISKVESSCADCLIPANGPQTIPGGSAGEIKVILDTANQRRALEKTLYVSSNDPISPVVLLAVTGYVRPAELVFSTRTIDFGKPRRTGSVNQEVFVPSSEEDKIEVTSVSSTSPYVTAALSPSTHKDRPGYVITTTLKPGAPIGEFKSTITINSNHPKQPKVEVPVTATIRGDIDLDRDSFFLGLAKKGSEKKAALTVSTVSPNPLKIDKIDCSLNCVSVSVAQRTEGKEYVLTATLKPDAPLGNIRGEVTIHTNNPDQPEIKVPVYAYVEE